MRYVAGRIVLGLLTVWLAATATFFAMHAVPGGPFEREKPLPAPVREHLAARYHLDRPVGEQYVAYLGALARLDLGPSYRYPDRSVRELIGQGFRVSALLGTLALAAALAAGVPVGVAAACRRGRWPDRAATLLVTLVFALPGFVVGAALIYVFAACLHWLPAGRWGTPAQAVLPVLTLAALPAAYISRLVRASLGEALAEDYVVAARARGLTTAAALWRHALPNALVPLTGYLTVPAVYILTGSIAVEQVFAIPGLGRDFIRSVLDRDYGMIMGLTVFVGALVVTATLLADLLHAALDPRLRAAGGGPR